MTKITTQLYAMLIAALAIAGLFTSGHLFNLMNVDIALDLLRVVLAATLIYVSFVAKNEHYSNMALLTVGLLYIGMGVIGVLSPTIGGLLPSGLTGFDIAFHLITGIAATAVSTMQRQGIRMNALHG
jgi:hypothetical protein